MASRLYWNTGVGWLAMSIGATSVWLAIGTTGVTQIAGLVLGTVTTIYVVRRLQKCYFTPWGRMHHRGMLAVAGLAGYEVASAQREGRDINPLTAQGQLIRVLNPGLSLEQSMAVFITLTAQRGGYLAKLMEEHPDILRRGLPQAENNDVLEHLRGLEMCAQLVIARSVELHFGREEAARYTLAILSGRAT